MLLRKLDIYEQKEIRCQSFSICENRTSKTTRRKMGQCFMISGYVMLFYNKTPTAKQQKQNHPN